MIDVREAAARAGRLSPYTNRLFYAVVLAVSLTGAGQAAAGWLGWWAPFAFAAVGAVELGGVALSMHADRRRQLGERAIPARVLSAGVALGAVAVNYFGHAAYTGPAAFFAGMSALGYTVWLIDSAARRRDALRVAGKLEETAPVYGLVAWLRHPGITRRARALALADPKLGKLGSLTAARDAVRAERRSAAISTALRKRITEHVDPTMAEIAVNTYDLDEIAARLAAGADYAGLTAILAAELVPARLHADTAEKTAQTAAEPPELVVSGDFPTPAEAAAIDAQDARDLAEAQASIAGTAPAPESAELPAAPASLVPVEQARPRPATSATAAARPAAPAQAAAGSKSAAILAALVELGAGTPATRVVAHLASQDMTVSEALVRKVRGNLAATAGPEWATSTGEVPTLHTLNGHRPTLAVVSA